MAWCLACCQVCGGGGGLLDVAAGRHDLVPAGELEDAGGT
jgi:hypothetical protein